MSITCAACGYTKIGLAFTDEGEYVNHDPEEENFQQVILPGTLIGSTGLKKYVAFYICPKCSTMQFKGEV